MGVLKKYNQETKNWDPIIGDASTIYTKNPLLTQKTEGEQMSIDEILLQNRQEIDALQHNVSWLALHGGGGSGTGGAGGDTSAPTIQILDPITRDTAITQLIWTSDMDNITSIPYEIKSRSRSTYSVRVTMNGEVVQIDTFTAKNQTNYISIASIKKYLKQGGNLVLTVTNTTIDEVYDPVILQIVLSTVTLSDSSLQLTIDDVINTNPILSMQGRTTVYGKYRLYFSRSQIQITTSNGSTIFTSNGVNLDTNEQYITIDISNSQTQYIQLDLKDKGLLESSIDSSAIYNYYFVLVYESNPSIRSSIASSTVTITVTNGILVVPHVGTIEQPFNITKDSTLSMQFTSFSNLTGTYTYQITYKERGTSDSNYAELVKSTSGNFFNQRIVTNVNLLGISGIENPTGDSSKIYDIRITVSYGAMIAEGLTAIRVQKSNAELLSQYKNALTEYTIFDFDFISLLSFLSLIFISNLNSIL